MKFLAVSLFLTSSTVVTLAAEECSTTWKCHFTETPPVLDANLDASIKYLEARERHRTETVHKWHGKFAYTRKDLAPLLNDDVEFHRLQESLRNHGAITNGVLRQKLHLVVYMNKQEAKP